MRLHGGGIAGIAGLNFEAGIGETSPYAGPDAVKKILDEQIRPTLIGRRYSRTGIEHMKQKQAGV